MKWVKAEEKKESKNKRPVTEDLQQEVVMAIFHVLDKYYPELEDVGMMEGEIDERVRVLLEKWIEYSEPAEYLPNAN